MGHQSVVLKLIVLCATWALGGCDSVSVEGDASPASRDARALVKRGADIFTRCQACHAVKAAVGHKVGPNLQGVAGSMIGTKSGFLYSDALVSAGGVWSDAALDQFLTEPSTYFPGTTMTFAGLLKHEERAAVIAYLKASSE